MVMTQEMLEANDLEHMERQMDRMLHLLFPSERRARPRVWHPPTDVYETEDAIIVKIEIAGMNPDDIHITFVDRILTISGTRQDMDVKSSYHRLEIHYGEFLSQVYLGGTYHADCIEAKYTNGLLYVTIPKARQEHRIPVRVPSSDEALRSRS